MKHVARIVPVLGLPLSPSSPAPAGEAEGTASFPAHNWTKLSGLAEPGCFWGQVLHWGAVMQEYHVPYSPRA